MPGPADLGLSRKHIHNARIIRDAVKADPEVIRTPSSDGKANASVPKLSGSFAMRSRVGGGELAGSRGKRKALSRLFTD